MSRRPVGAGAVGLLAAGLQAGCSGAQHALQPAGPAAAEIEWLWWVLFWVCLVVFVLVVGLFLAVVVLRHRGRERPGRPLSEAGGRTLVLWAGALVPLVILVGLTVVTAIVSARLVGPEREADLTIDVVAHQFWWEVRYPELDIVTANEIHIPAGRTVALRLTSSDVIHSFWVPRLHGKIDMMRGKTNHFWIEADEPGVFRGQCAEFCGIQHAFMAFLVIAQGEEEFRDWAARHRMPAPAPATDPERRGLAVFRLRECGFCHEVRGLHSAPAQEAAGPDLTHIAGRRTLGAATVRNTPANLAAWILDPHQVKPGVRMPATTLAPEELHALLAFLAGLR